VFSTIPRHHERRRAGSIAQIAWRGPECCACVPPVAGMSGVRDSERARPDIYMVDAEVWVRATIVSDDDVLAAEKVIARPRKQDVGKVVSEPARDSL
jgi:hypothetical protein